MGVAHPSEFSTGVAPIGGDVLHPLAAQLTSPMHWAA